MRPVDQSIPSGIGGRAARAYEGRLHEVRRALEAYGLERSGLRVANMLAEIQAEGQERPAGTSRYVVRRRARAAIQ